MGQFLAATGLAILVALAGRAPSPVLTMVFNWHGYRAGLDAEGKGGPPVGLHDLRAAGITHVGVPQDHTGDFGHRDYIADIEALGIRVVRTTEQRWNAGLFRRDLGGIILAWRSADEPGSFFQGYIENLRAPWHPVHYTRPFRRHSGEESAQTHQRVERQPHRTWPPGTGTVAAAI